MARRKIKKDLIDGGVIEGPGPHGFIIRRSLSTALVRTQISDKLQIIPKKTRPPKRGARSAFIKAFEETRGNISKSCRMAKVSRQTIYRWLESPRPINERFRQRLRSTRPLEAKLDFYEGCLEDSASGVSEGSATASIFALKTLGGHRGYVEPRYMPQASSDVIESLVRAYSVLCREFQDHEHRSPTDLESQEIIRVVMEANGRRVDEKVFRKALLSIEIDQESGMMN